MGDDQKETRKSSFFSCFFPLSSCLFPDSSPLEITGKKAWLILCNFTFMFSFSRRILSWFVLVDVLIAMAEITFNCSSLKKKKGFKTACEQNKKNTKQTQKNQPCCVAKPNINFSKTTTVFSHILKPARVVRRFESVLCFCFFSIKPSPFLSEHFALISNKKHFSRVTQLLRFMTPLEFTEVADSTRAADTWTRVLWLNPVTLSDSC